MEEKVTFLKKKENTEDSSILQARRDEMVKAQPVVDDKRGLVFVNGSKYARAKAILDLVLGTQVPREQKEIDRKEHYTKLLIANEIEIGSDDSLPAIYELLGGLIMTVEKFEARQKEIKLEQERAKKDRMGMSKVQ